MYVDEKLINFTRDNGKLKKKLTKTKTIYEYLSENLFEVPLYQRNIVWNKSEMEVFYDSLLSYKFDDEEDKESIGSIILYEDHKNSRKTIVDGLQRTTFLIFFITACIEIINGEINTLPVKEQKALNKNVTNLTNKLGLFSNSVVKLAPKAFDPNKKDYSTNKPLVKLQSGFTIASQIAKLCTTKEERTTLALFKNIRTKLKKEEDINISNLLFNILHNVQVEIELEENERKAMDRFHKVNGTGSNLTWFDKVQSLIESTFGNDHNSRTSWQEVLNTFDGNQLEKVVELVAQTHFDSFEKLSVKNDYYYAFRDEFDKDKSGKITVNFVEEIKNNIKLLKHIIGLDKNDDTKSDEIDVFMNESKLTIHHAAFYGISTILPEGEQQDFLKEEIALICQYHRNIGKKDAKTLENFLYRFLGKLKELRDKKEGKKPTMKEVEKLWGDLDKEKFRPKRELLITMLDDFYEQKVDNRKALGYYRFLEYFLNKENEMKTYRDLSVEHIFPQKPEKGMINKYSSNIVMYEKKLNTIPNLLILPNGKNIVGSNKSPWVKEQTVYNTVTPYIDGVYDEVIEGTLIEDMCEKRKVLLTNKTLEVFGFKEEKTNNEDNPDEDNQNQLTTEEIKDLIKEVVTENQIKKEVKDTNNNHQKESNGFFKSIILNLMH